MDVFMVMRLRRIQCFGEDPFVVLPSSVGDGRALGKQSSSRFRQLPGSGLLIFGQI